MAVRGMCVALVDDDAVFRDALAGLLEMAGMSVEQYDTGEDFLFAVTEECQAVCVILDIQLGGMTGLEVAERLEEAGFDRPVIFMTGSIDEGFERRARELGCVAYLRKPFRRDALLEAIMVAAAATGGTGQGV